jgi:hypothetical protein
MTITTTKAAEMADGYRGYPINDHGKLRFQYGKVTQSATEAGDDGSFFQICKLPPGRKRILPYLSRYKVSALGSSRVMKFGHAAYLDRGDVSDAGEAANDSAFMSAVDVSSAVNSQWPVLAASPLKYDIYSVGEVVLYGTITGGTIPVSATFEFIIAYIYE